MKKETYIGCRVMPLPKKEQYSAALQAICINPANQIPPGVISRIDTLPSKGTVPEKEMIGVLTSKWHGPSGVHLTVGFMSKAPATLQDKIVEYFNKWSEYCNASFDIFKGAVSGADIRISLGQGGYFSYLGTDIFQIPKAQQTMNLQGFSLSTPDSEYLRVPTHEVAHCLAGDTLIDCPRDLEKYPLGIPIKELVGQHPWVYAWNNGQVVIRKAVRVWKSGSNAKTIRVRLSPGQGRKSSKFLPPLELVGTSEHLVLLSDGTTWRKLGDLKPGDRLCSLYRSSGGARSQIVWTGGERVREHVFVAEQVYGERPVDHHAHHINSHMMDQTPENLEWKLESLHHHDHHFGRKDSEETRKLKAGIWKGRKHSKESRKKMSESQKNKEPASEETRAKISAATKGRLQSPEAIEKRTEAMRRFYANGGRSGMYGKEASEETKAKQSASMKATLERKRQQAVNNHMVVSIEVAESQDVYDMTVPNADSFVANGVIVHNSMGCPHEHMRKEVQDLLDKLKTEEYYERTQRWSQDEVDQQIFALLGENSIKGTPHAETDSIMCYPFPGAITRNGKPIPGGVKITASDGAFMSTVYPKVVTPPPSAGTTIALVFSSPPVAGTYTAVLQDDGPPPTP